ncbi:unnamed protein product [Rotaria sp. Silwood1]|nr:unnamed protein product [Rotaria sp. Silwood1]
MSKLSDFYVACQNGDLTTVESLISSMSLKEINRLESNGSTALHAATSNGHTSIILLLLMKGVSRCIVDKHNKTPIDYTPTTDVKQLFDRSITAMKERYIQEDTPQIKWASSRKHRDEVACDNYCEYMRPSALSEITRTVIDHIDTFIHSAGMNQIHYFIEKAIETKDTSYLLRAYTAEIDFYRKLNFQLAALGEDTWSRHMDDQSNKWARIFAGQIAKDPTLDKYRWTGRCYRGMRMTAEELHQYNLNSLNRPYSNLAFLSTSKKRHVAERFACIPSSGKLAAICTYDITDRRVALDIHSISEFPDEEEVLIIPNMVFKVLAIKDDNPIEIALQSLPLANDFRDWDTDVAS